MRVWSGDDRDSIPPSVCWSFARESSGVAPLGVHKPRDSSSAATACSAQLVEKLLPKPPSVCSAECRYVLARVIAPVTPGRPSTCESAWTAAAVMSVLASHEPFDCCAETMNAVVFEIMLSLES
jgi:hypothetical protein